MSHRADRRSAEAGAPRCGGEGEGIAVFERPGCRGEVAAAHRPPDLGELLRILDPAAAGDTLHWGRNYLYVASFEGPAGAVEVVVKQFRNEGWIRRLRRRLHGSKAEKSWRVAWALAAAGIGTPEPVAWVESSEPEGPSWYISRHLPGLLEARYYLRSLNAGEEGESFPQLPPESFLAAVAGFARRLHDAGFWHRDYSAGNLLLDGGEGWHRPRLFLVDLNRTRRPGRVSLVRRMRDLGRLPVARLADRRLLLSEYFREEGGPTVAARCVYRLVHATFHGRHRLKNRVRGATPRRRQWRGRRPYPHLPPSPQGASRRDRVVWDRLSDQPHQHAGRLDKLAVRASDAAVHLVTAAIVLRHAPRAWVRYRELTTDPIPEGHRFGGLGVGLRPHADDPQGLLAAVEELGVRHLLLRLHPWDRTHGAEEALARELSRRGCELVFTLPQNRALVCDLARWREAVAEVAGRFAPYGRWFQLGQAINRSKWGVWNHAEYQRLAAVAAEELRSYSDLRLLGPAVIDFEPHHAVAALNWPRGPLTFDAMASLLYVDRRGAPEARQLGFDAAGKARLARAIADTARRCAARSWITEVNWPLWEGPHAPAGRDVAVEERTQADYLERYYLLTLVEGWAERVYWWQLVARGYGLVDPAGRGLRRRPAFRALAALQRWLDGVELVERLAGPEGTHRYRFATAEGQTVVAGWSHTGAVRVPFPGRVVRIADRDGEVAPAAGEVELGPTVRYVWLE